MELLRARARLAPLEEADGVGPPGDVRQAVPDRLAAVLGTVDRLPVHGARRVLHEEPGSPPGDAAGEVRAEGQLGAGVLERVHDVVVGADDVLVGGPLVVVEVAEVAHRHEVRRHGHPGRQLVEDGLLGAVEVEQRVRSEPGVVQLLGRVGECRRAPRRQDLLPLGVALAPERRPPGLVEGVEVGVACTCPPPERPRAGVAVTGQVVAGVLVGDVPKGQRRVVAVARRQVRGQGEGVLAVDLRARAPRLPAARPERVSVPVDGQRLGERRREPRRRGGRAGGEVHGDPGVPEQVHDLVEPVRLVFALGRLEPGPREDAQRDEGDPRLAHQPDVLGPGGPGPLLGVVVATEGETGAGPSAHERQCWAP